MKEPCRFRFPPAQRYENRRETAKDKVAQKTERNIREAISEIRKSYFGSKV